MLLPFSRKLHTLSRGFLLLSLASVLLIANSQCTEPLTSDSEPKTGDVQITTFTDAQRMASVADIFSVELTVSGPGISPDLVFNLTQTGSTWGGIVQIPVGSDRVFSVVASDNTATPIYTGTATGVTISEGAPINLMISLLEVAPATVEINSVPRFVFINLSSNAVAPDDPVDIFASAEDLDGDPITFSWTASHGTLGAQTDTATTSDMNWIAPGSDAAAQVTIQIQDDKLATNAITLDIDVNTANQNGDVVIDLGFNNLPVITSLTADPGQLTPAAKTTQLEALVDNPNPVTFAWTKSGCGGSFDDNTLQTPSYTASNGTLNSVGNCLFTVTVTDTVNGGFIQQQLSVPKGPSPIDLGPVVVNSIQSTNSVDDGDTVSFAVNATDPEGQPLTFVWSASDGSLGTQSDTAVSSQVVLTAPSCADAPIAVSVTVSDPAGNETVRDFIDLNHATVCVVPNIYLGTANGLNIAPVVSGHNFVFDTKTTADGFGDNSASRVAFAGGNIYVAHWGSGSGGVSKSSDGGATWTNYSTADGFVNINVQGLNAEGTNVYAGTGAGLVVSNDSGSTWTNRTTADGLANNVVRSIAVDGTKVFVATTQGVSISTDDGASFTPSGSLGGFGEPDVYFIRKIDGVLYAGADWLYISTDDGATWTQRTNADGLPNSLIYAVHAVGNVVYVGGHYGLAISTDGGVTFTPITTADGLPNNNIRSLDEHNGTWYIGGYGGLTITDDHMATSITKTTADGLAGGSVWTIGIQ